MSDVRFQELSQWLKQALPEPIINITPLAGDASFRRYFRLHLAENRTLVAMDAPPERENSHPFVAIAQAFHARGLQVPKIIAANLTHGFLVLSDLGDRLYLSEINNNNVDNLYSQALALLPKIHTCPEIPGWPLPNFVDKLIVNELEIFSHWFLKQHLKINLDCSIQNSLSSIFNQLIEIAKQQPQVCVHRDFHSRNLLVLANGEVGVIDFQDAVWGPIVYDAVSLLRDCYINWPREWVEKWILEFYALLIADNLLKNGNQEQFLMWFDWVGIQRHLKVLGIFARLYHRDNKPGYLKDIPRILNYLITVTSYYPQLQPLSHFFQAQVLPQFPDITL